MRIFTDEHRAKLRQARVGMKLSKIHTQNISKGLSGRKFSEEHKNNLRMAAKRGSESHLWRGGVSTQRKIGWSQPRYREWRRKVFEKDEYKCRECGAHGVKLNADHIKPWATHPHLRYRLSNGRALCVPCHRKTPTYGILTARKRANQHQPKLLGQDRT